MRACLEQLFTGLHTAQRATHTVILKSVVKYRYSITCLVHLLWHGSSYMAVRGRVRGWPSATQHHTKCESQKFSWAHTHTDHCVCGGKNTNRELLTLRLSRRLSRPRCRLRRARDDRYRSLAARVSPYYGHNNGQTLTTRSRLAFFMFRRLRGDNCSRGGSADRADTPSGQHPLRQRCTECQACNWFHFRHLG